MYIYIHHYMYMNMQRIKVVVMQTQSATQEWNTQRKIPHTPLNLNACNNLFHMHNYTYIYIRRMNLINEKMSLFCLLAVYHRSQAPGKQAPGRAPTCMCDGLIRSHGFRIIITSYDEMLCIRVRHFIQHYHI